MLQYNVARLFALMSCHFRCHFIQLHVVILLYIL